MVETREISLAGIAVLPRRMRSLRQDVVDALAESMAAQGLLQPIILRPSEATGFYLIAGRHRHAAARQLGWTSIRSTIVDTTDADTALLAEIDENLIRSDLSPAERAAHQAARKEVYERIHPESKPTKEGGPGRGKSTQSQVGIESAAAFIDDTAKKTGKGRTTIAREAKRGKDIPNVVVLAGTSLDKGDELDALARLSPEKQAAVIDRAVAGEKVSAKAEAKKDQRATRERVLGGIQLALPDKRYGVIYADPEWRFEVYSRDTGMDRAADNHYPTSGTDAICARPVGDIAADDCVLFLWATVPMLPDALKVMNSWGFCVGVGTRVLTADLRWERAENLFVGQRLLAFDESARGTRRYYRWSTVLGTGVEPLPSYRITMEDGQELVASSEHAWLMRTSSGAEGQMRWIKTKDLAKHLNHYNRRKPLMLPRLAPVTDPDRTFEGGFVSGAFDSEGHLGGRHSDIRFSQKPNALLIEVQKFLRAKGFPFAAYPRKHDGVISLKIGGGRDEFFKFLMTYQPPRLMDNWRKLNLTMSAYNLANVAIKSVEFIGATDCVTLTTSTGTYIAEGFGAHNTYKSHCIWTKDKTGTGYWFRNSHELLLVGTKGNIPAPAMGTQWASMIEGRVTKHSAKPERFYELIEGYFPNLPKIELNARNARAGWDAWGLEAPTDAAGTPLAADAETGELVSE